MRAIDGQVLRVHLSDRQITREEVGEGGKRFLGGRGLNQWILLKELDPATPPLSAGNLLVMGTGSLVGTPAPAACRLSIDSKNPFTNGIGSSNCGGNFAAELRLAGFNHVVIQGKSETPVYLFIDDHRVEIRDARHLWGKTTWETDARIKEEIGDPNIQMIYIGPAGEKIVRGACIITDLEKAAGRCGMGAVMGSKNLKAVAVRGTGSVELSHPDSFMGKASEILAKLQANPFLKKRGEYGIYGQVLWGENSRESSWRNFQGGILPSPEQVARIHPDIFLRQYKKKSISCGSCPIHCRVIHEIKGGPHKGLISEGLENNDIQLFGAKLNVFDPDAILYLRSLCNQYGLDTDNTSGVLAWAFECYQRGIIGPDTTDGLELKWGDVDAYILLIERMASRQGFGNILAEGSLRAAQRVGKGSERYAMHIKGQDLTEQLWVHKGWALGTVVSARGGTHTRGAILTTRFESLPQELCRKYFGLEKIGRPNDYEGKARCVVLFEKIQALADSLGLCTFATLLWAPLPQAMDQNDMAELLSACTGVDMSPEELMEIGERVHTLEKAFNVLHTDWTRKDDYPPRRFVEEKVMMAGPFQGECLSLPKWDQMLDEYYDLHGWERKSGRPTRKTLEKVGLQEVADILGRARKLPKT